jgi:hypothetical protein
LRILLVWIVAASMIFVVSVGWWVSLPIVLGVAQGLNSSITNTNARLVVTGVKYVAYVWGAILVLFIVLWAIISSQQRDVESAIYG